MGRRNEAQLGATWRNLARRRQGIGGGERASGEELQPYYPYGVARYDGTKCYI